MLVAAIQFKPTLKDKMGNLRKLAALIKQAAEGGAKLIVTPELGSVGYTYLSDTEAREQAEFIHPDILTTKMMRTLAEKLNVHIAFGLIEKDGGTDHLYNSQVMVSPDGTWVSMRKINKAGTDYLWAKAGRANPPIIEIDDNGKLRKVGLLVCRDIRNKRDSKWEDFYEEGDADIVAFSTAWGRGFFPANAWMEFVEEHNCVLVAANVYGIEGPNDFGEGGSCIIEPPDKVHINGLQFGADCIVMAEV